MTRATANALFGLVAFTACTSPFRPPDTGPIATVDSGFDAGIVDAYGLDAAIGTDGGRADVRASDVTRYDVHRRDVVGPTVPTVRGPTLLSETGLYSDFGARTLADGIIAFTPRYELWSDGAEKSRYLLLPPGTRIDTSDLDHWVFPVGTRVWKDFRVDGRLIETRLMQKVDASGNGWWMVAYLWNDTATDAVATPDGLDAASGTTHRVPSQEDCVQCHSNVRDVLIGVSAIQLTSASGPSTLSELVARGLLSAPPASEPNVPGAGPVQAALGYLHGNCGHCHNDQSFFHTESVLRLRLSVNDHDAVTTPTYRTSINVRMFHDLGGITLGVVPREPDRSQLYMRMGLRTDLGMPPVCTLRADADGLATIRNWINVLE